MVKINILKVILGWVFTWKLIKDHNYTYKILKQLDIKYKSYKEIPQMFCSAPVQSLFFLDAKFPSAVAVQSGLCQTWLVTWKTGFLTLRLICKLITAGSILVSNNSNEGIICPCNVHPLTPHFHIVKLVFTGVYIFLIFALKHRLWVLVRTASVRRF